jgi:hypothetical protein
VNAVKDEETKVGGSAVVRVEYGVLWSDGSVESYPSMTEETAQQWTTALQDAPCHPEAAVRRTVTVTPWEPLPPSTAAVVGVTEDREG